MKQVDAILHVSSDGTVYSESQHTLQSASKMPFCLFWHTEYRSSKDGFFSHLTSLVQLSYLGKLSYLKIFYVITVFPKQATLSSTVIIRQELSVYNNYLADLLLEL